MDLLAAILFLLLYFVRLHEWVPFLGALNLIKPAMALGAFGLFAREVRTPAWRFMRTPHEWAMAGFLISCLWFDPNWYDTLPNILPLASFYFLTAYALNSTSRLEKYFGWWCFCVVFMAALGTLTVAGIDVTHASELIVGSMGRLVLNTSLMDNPNALGHTAVSGITMIYMMLVFRRDVGLRFLALPLFVVVGVCVFSTESKGSYISGGAAFATALLVGRKLWVQVLVACGLLVAAYAVSTMLPRMVDRSALRQDEGVVGRLLAFEAARTAYDTIPAGWKKFEPVVKYQGQDVAKATHSSYVQIGADLGPVGLFFYLSTFCCAARTLIRLRTDSDSLERCRRLLFALIVGFAVSGWMITRPYHAEFFLLMGAVTAYHRLALENLQGIVPEFGGASIIDKVIPGREVKSEEPMPAEAQDATFSEEVELPQKQRFWNRYGFVDFGIAYAALQLTVWCWDYIIENL